MSLKWTPLRHLSGKMIERSKSDIRKIITTDGSVSVDVGYTLTIIVVEEKHYDDHENCTTTYNLEAELSVIPGPLRGNNICSESTFVMHLNNILTLQDVDEFAMAIIASYGWKE